MKGLKHLSELSQGIVYNDRRTYVSLYYSVENDTVYDYYASGSKFVIALSRPHTKKEIRDCVDSLVFWYRDFNVEFTQTRKGAKK